MKAVVRSSQKTDVGKRNCHKSARWILVGKDSLVRTKLTSTIIFHRIMLKMLYTYIGVFQTGIYDHIEVRDRIRDQKKKSKF